MIEPKQTEEDWDEKAIHPESCCKLYFNEETPAEECDHDNINCWHYDKWKSTQPKKVPEKLSETTIDLNLYDYRRKINEIIEYLKTDRK